MHAVGLDLAGKPENDTGFCLLITPGKEAPLGRSDIKILHNDQEIMEAIVAAQPDVVAVDAPFYLPKGLPWRACDMALLKRGFRPLSPVLPTMQILTLRASMLVKQLRAKGYRVIEVFPRAAEIMLGLSKEPRRNQDEYDALLAALVGRAYLEGRYEDVEGIILPK
jgi:predicted nuclease with RNAse H fold